MDQEMGDALEADFLSVEIDLDYEFDAARHFDLSREETPFEAREAELWFERAGSYPPSPFVANLNMGGVLVGNVNTLKKFKDIENFTIIAHTDIGSGSEFSILDESYKGLSFQNCTPQDVTTDGRKSTKVPFSSGSTLMKPTASQLAKQNRPREVKSASRFVDRFQKLQVQQSERSFEDPSENGVQAAKRQKLNGGNSRKIAGVEQQTDLMHKVLQKKKPLDYNCQLPRLRLTIPREPELETTRRAQRLRAQRSRSNDCKQLQEGDARVTPIFKAQPLNRKILEGPSLPLSQKSMPWLPEFQISKNSIPTSTVRGGESGSGRFQFHASCPSQLQKDDQKRGTCESVLPFFKARPLNKNVLSSKGDMGVFRSTKREATVPMEFKFSTKKGFKQDPPTELLNKLSLNSEERKVTSQAKLLWPTLGDIKGAKENLIGCAQQRHMDINQKTESQRAGIKQIDFGSGIISDYRSQSNRFRSFDIR